jgi:hypothetical protein
MTDARERYDFPTRGLLTKAERWMYPGGRPNGLARLLNRGWAIVHAAGLLPQHFVTLEVPGRRTGRMLSFPLVIGHERRIRTGCSTFAPPVDGPCCAMAAARPCAWRRSTPALGRRSCADSCRSRPGRGPSYRSLASEAAAGVSHQVGVSIVGCERVPLACFQVKASQKRGGAGTRAVEPGPRHPVPRVDRRVVRAGGPMARAVGDAGAAADLLLRRGRPRRRQGRRGHSPARMRDHRGIGRGRGTSACTQVARDQRAPAAAATRAIPGRIGRALRSGALTTGRPDVQRTTRFASACLTPEGGIAA